MPLSSITADPSHASPNITPLGDAALLITLGDSISRELAVRVNRVHASLVMARIVAVTDIVPAYATVAVYYDASETSYNAVQHAVMRALERESDITDDGIGHEHVIPVRYDGLDLADVAMRTELSVAEVIERHVAPTYYVYMLGFVPGFAYLGDLDPALVLARRTEPRTRVPAGSVAIAGAQTAVYPLATPGGWHILGTTDAVMFDSARRPPALLQAGDTVRFEPVRS